MAHSPQSSAWLWVLTKATWYNRRNRIWRAKMPIRSEAVRLPGLSPRPRPETSVSKPMTGQSGSPAILSLSRCVIVPTKSPCRRRDIAITSSSRAASERIAPAKLGICSGTTRSAFYNAPVPSGLRRADGKAVPLRRGLAVALQHRRTDLRRTGPHAIPPPRQFLIRSQLRRIGLHRLPILQEQQTLCPVRHRPHKRLRRVQRRAIAAQCRRRQSAPPLPRLHNHPPGSAHFDGFP